MKTINPNIFSFLSAIKTSKLSFNSLSLDQSFCNCSFEQDCNTTTERCESTGTPPGPEPPEPEPEEPSDCGSIKHIECAPTKPQYCYDGEVIDIDDEGVITGLF